MEKEDTEHNFLMCARIHTDLKTLWIGQNGGRGVELEFPFWTEWEI